MGIYDRDYSRDEPQGIFLGGTWSMVTTLIVINVAIFFIDNILFDQGDGALFAREFSLEPFLFTRHWQVWQLLTYGFFHDSLYHLGFNMLGLFFFGKEVEAIYGRKEMLWTYLTLVIGAGLITVAAQYALPQLAGGNVLGASGAIFGIIVLFVCHFPTRLIHIWGVFPVPAWALATVYILMNLASLSQAVGGGSTGNRVAFETHLGGAALGFLYYRTRWNLGRLLPGKMAMRRWKPGPKLRIHKPEQNETSLSDRVDQILEKISAQGESSLTREERKILQDASRRYQRRKSGNS